MKGSRPLVLRQLSTQREASARGQSSQSVYNPRRKAGKGAPPMHILNELMCVMHFENSLACSKCSRM